jgi:class I fructose-bisphosphate aldolase
MPATLTPTRLDHLSVNLGKRVRLWRLLYGAGPANGSLLVLPLDQGMEHGPADFFPNPAALDTDFQFRLALEGRYSAIALGIGLAEKYFHDYCGRVPLILKLNAKTNIPPDDDAVSPLTASVEDAVRLGADAIGYTLYVGTPRQDFEFLQFQPVRQQAERYGMPIVMWAYPRGRAIEAQGGKGTLFAIDYAARVAEELGADIVKLHEPNDRTEGVPEPYRSLHESTGQRLQRVVRSAGRCLVLFSGGSKMDAEAAIAKVDLCMRAGAAGIIFGRNLWQRPYDEALALSRRVHEVMARYPA